MTEQRREAESFVPGERTTTPVSGTSLDPNRMVVRRGIAVCALIAFGAFFIWGGWGRSKAGPEEKSTKPVVSQRAAYEAPREPDPPTPRPEPPAQYAALGPVVRPFRSSRPGRRPTISWTARDGRPSSSTTGHRETRLLLALPWLE